MPIPRPHRESCILYNYFLDDALGFLPVNAIDHAVMPFTHDRQPVIPPFM